MIKNVFQHFEHLKNFWFKMNHPDIVIYVSLYMCIVHINKLIKYLTFLINLSIRLKSCFNIQTNLIQEIIYSKHC